jgi:hypothetical protein
MREIHNGRECFGGYVFVDSRRESDVRRMGPCRVCAERAFIKHIGGREMTWENWVCRAELAAAVEAFAAWYPHDENHACLLHSGCDEDTSGAGKTHLLSAAGIAYIRKGYRIRYWNAADLAENRFDPWFIEAIGEFNGLALIDDLGNDPNYPMNRDSVDRLLDYRYRHRRATIVAARLSIGTIENRYHRFYARMKFGTRIALSASPFKRDRARDHESPRQTPVDAMPAQTLFEFSDDAQDRSFAP